MMTCGRDVFQNDVLQQERGILVARHAWGQLVAVGDVVAEFYLETVAMDAVRMFIGHLGELEVVGGDDTRDGLLQDAFKEES